MVRLFSSPTPQGLLNLGFIRMVTGTYTGNGAATQAITGVGFQPKLVMIYQQVAVTEDVYIKTDQDGTRTKFYDGGGADWEWRDDMIISLDADGFTVGDGTGWPSGWSPNIAAAVCTYICWG